MPAFVISYSCFQSVKFSPLRIVPYLAPYCPLGAGSLTHPRGPSNNNSANLVGALHEVGYLQNSLSPYWKEFRADESAWIERCLARLVTADHDYWALAALLGCNGPTTVSIAIGQGFKSAATRLYERFDKPNVHVNTLYLAAIGKVLHPVLEIGYDTNVMINVDVGRARALCLDNAEWQPGDSLGAGGLSISMQAKLPHGAWRSVCTAFETWDA